MFYLDRLRLEVLEAAAWLYSSVVAYQFEAVVALDSVLEVGLEPVAVVVVVAAAAAVALEPAPELEPELEHAVLGFVVAAVTFAVAKRHWVCDHFVVGRMLRIAAD